MRCLKNIVPIAVLLWSTETNALWYESQNTTSQAYAAQTLCGTGKRFDLALEDFASLQLAATGDNRIKSGDCGEEYCGSTKITVKGGVKVPLAFKGARWWGIPVQQSLQCHASWSGCAEQNSCGQADTCAENKLGFTCGLGGST